MPIVTRKATLTIDILVVGGGIGGLAVAYMLSNAGHRVRVLERHDLNAPGAGVRVPPNLSKILRQWVGLEELMKVARRCVGSPFYRRQTGEKIGYLPWKPAVMVETGGDFLLMHHADLVQLLHTLAVGAGARIDLNTEVVSISQGTSSSPNPSVTLANGEVLSADLLIGADGTKSMVRDAAFPNEIHVKPSGLTIYTGIVSREDMLKDEELRPLVLSEETWPIWLGEHRALCAQAMPTRQAFCFGLYSWPGDTLEQGVDGGWHDTCSNEKILVDGHCSVMDKMMRLSPQVFRTQYLEPPNDGIPNWVDSSKQIVLLGDAAHPSMPGGNNATSLAVEDAVVLGSLFSHLRTADQIPSFLSGYEDLRQRRCNFVCHADVAHARQMVLPPGPDADSRDQNVRRSPDEWDEGTTKAQFEEIAEIFVYDAGDAAEEWWINWGRLYATARKHPNLLDLRSYFAIDVHSH
ncbi:FAD/NAD(P)-binding domain-containing protein [Earliella scabrosa]|nr:FAD/NAD(P)-binding domain-containing protein [Earliella scabrosa]